MATFLRYTHEGIIWYSLHAHMVETNIVCTSRRKEDHRCMVRETTSELLVADVNEAESYRGRMQEGAGQSDAFAAAEQVQKENWKSADKLESQQHVD